MEEVVAHLRLLTLAIKAMSDNIVKLMKVKLGKTETAADSAKLEGMTLDEIAGSSQGPVGYIPFIGKENTNLAFAPAELMTKLRMASTDAQITALKSSEQSFADVFNKWKRISHNASGKYPALPEEINAWQYDAAVDTVKMPLNTGSLVGMVSPYTFEEYTFDVVVSSANQDDDGIGIILGFKTINGVEHTLIAQVTTGGLDWNAFSAVITPRMNIVINQGQGAARGNKLVFAGELGFPRQGFNGVDAAPGIRIQAVRRADGIMTVKCMRPDGTNFPAGEVKWTGTIPAPFNTPCAIGYMSFSQALSTYRNITVPQPKSDIIDTRNLDLHRWNNTGQSWSIVGKAGNLLPKGRLFKNTEGTQGSFYMDFDGNLVQLNVAEQTVSVNEYFNLTTGAVKEYDLVALLGSYAGDFDIKTADVTVRVKEANVASPLTGLYIDATAVANYGIRDERYIVVANQSAITQSLYVKIAIKPK